jgi:hypothetical protein
LIRCSTRRSTIRRVTDDAGQDLLLAQGDSKLLIGPEDFRVDFIERLQHVPLRRGVVIEVLVVDRAVIDTRPMRFAHGQPAAIGLEPPFEHPGRIVLLRRNETNGIFAQALGGLVGFDIGDEPIFILVDINAANPLYGLLQGRR